MTTFTAARAAATFPVAKPSTAGTMCVAYGTIAVAVNPVANDFYEMVRVPAGAVVVGGQIFSSDMDTNATETLDLDIGWKDNGADGANLSGFGNLGVQGTDTLAGIKSEAGYNYQFGGVLMTTGPQAFTRETVIGVNTIATAATFAAGNLSLVVYYIVP